MNFLYLERLICIPSGAIVLAGKDAYHTSSHGSQEELKFMINLLSPKFFIPLHGEFKMLNAHAKVAKICINR